VKQLLQTQAYTEGVPRGADLTLKFEKCIVLKEKKQLP